MKKIYFLLLSFLFLTRFAVQGQNDLCTNAITINCGQTISSTTVGATLDAVGTCVTALNTAPGVWYTFVGDGQQSTLSLCGSAYDTKIGAFSGTCAALVCITGNDDFCGLQSEISFPTVIGTTYYILVTGFNANVGTFTLTRTCTPPPPDPCTIITNIAACVTPVVTAHSGGGLWSVGTCGFTTPGQERIYSFTPTVTGLYNLEVTAVGVAGFLDYYYKPASGGCNTTGWICIDDNSAVGTDPIGLLTAGTQYYILVDDETTAATTHTFQISCAIIPPANDLCAGALNINCGQTISASTTTATIDAGAGTCVTALNTAPGVWYTFAGDGSITTLSLCGSAYDTKIGVFSGSCAGLVCVTGNDDFCGLQSEVTFNTTVGTTYYILVTGFLANAGNFTLARTCVFPCTGTPASGTVSGAPVSTICSGTSVTLTLSGYTVGTGIAIQWKTSIVAGGPYTNIPGATNPTYTFTPTATAYYIATVSCIPSGFSANSNEVVVRVSAPVHSAVSATPSTTCTPGATVITGTVSNGTLIGGNVVVGSSGTLNLAIPDAVAAGVTTPAIVLPAGTTFTNAADLKIRINARHSWVGDLRFTVTSPCGVTFLFDRPGVPASTFGNSANLGTSNAATPPPAVYTFDLAAATVIPEAAPASGFIPTGNYRPSDVGGAPHNWAGLVFPCAGAGNWTLNVSDNGGGDLGLLVDWAILAPSTTPGNYTHTLTGGAGTIVQNPSTGPNDATGNFSVTAIPAGNHVFTLTSTDILGCSVSTPVSVTVNTTPVVTITPAAPVICAGAIQQLDASALPGTTQTFSSGTINLAIPDAVAAGVTTAPIVLPAGLSITSAANLRVSINARHSWVGDLKFTLTSPCGTTFLFDRPGVPASTFGNSANLGTSNAATPPPAVYIFDLAAAIVIPEAAPASGFIPTGSYRPSDVAGAPHNWAGLTFPCAATGNWTLNISDNGGGDLGLLVDWAILYTQPSPVTFTPVTNLFTNAGATTPYVAGTPVNTVWTNSLSTITYTASSTIAGCTGTANVTVTVNQLPAITTQPTALAAPACPGINVTYTVAATGTGLTYQWQLSTDNGVTYTNVVNNATYSGATSNSLVISNVAISMNNYRYRVIVSGTCPPAVTSNAVILVVATAPTITTQPANLTVCANSNATFTVVAGGIPAPVIYQWQVSTDGGTTWTNLLTGGSFTPTLTITGATTAMNGFRYRVLVTNTCGQTTTSAVAILTVNPLPVVTATPLASRICISDTLVPLTGSPVGGSWTGIGVSGFNFVPSATAVGTYTLTYTYTSSLNCTATATVTAKVEDCQERLRLLSDDAVILYPNPNTGRFNIRINSTLYNYLGFKVYNSQGQLVNGVLVNDILNSPILNGLVYGRVIPIDISHLPAGLYIVKFYYDDGIRSSEKAFKVVVGAH